MTLNIKMDARELRLVLRALVALTTLLLGARVLGPAMPHAGGPRAVDPPPSSETRQARDAR